MTLNIHYLNFFAIGSISLKIAAQHRLDIENIQWSQTDELALRNLEKSHLVCGHLRRERVGDRVTHQLLKLPICLHSRLENRIAKGWKDDPDTLSILKNRAQSDDSEYVRGTAVKELARGWKNEPGMFELLSRCAVDDPFERKERWQINPRQTALEAISDQYPDHHQTLPLLCDRAENDPDVIVRDFAQSKLKIWVNSRSESKT